MLTYEEARDKYLYIVYGKKKKYKLDEDRFHDLVVVYCEYVQTHVNVDESVLPLYIHHVLEYHINKPKVIDVECISLDYLYDHTYEIDGIVEDEELLDALHYGLERIPKKWFEILNLYFGLQGDPLSLEKCDKALGQNPGYVRGNKRVAINYLRRAMLKKLCRSWIISQFKLNDCEGCKYYTHGICECENAIYCPRGYTREELYKVQTT